MRSSSPLSRLSAALLPALLVAGLASLSAGCGTSSTTAAEIPPTPDPQEVSAVTVSRQRLARELRVTGTLLADEQAEVAAEIAGRVVGTPVERGTLVREGQTLVQISAVEKSAQMKEAEANVAQVAAALDLGPNGEFDVERVPEVANARAELRLAESEFDRIRSLLDQRVVSQSEFDQRRTRVEAATQAYEAARNGARQRYSSYTAALARLSLARQGVADTRVRAPFTGVVAERRVSTGDYVNVGTAVVTVVRIQPLRLALTVPEQYISRVAAGQAVTLTVDAYPDRTFEATVRYVSPALSSEQRALTVEAVVPNADRELKPGMFATAQLELQAEEDVLVVDARAIQEAADTRRAFVVVDARLEERIVTIGQRAGSLVEVVTGLAEGETVAVQNGRPLRDRLPVRVVAGAAPSTRAGATAAAGDAR